MSDAHRDEIAKLEALYEEHPEGRIFTHLAEAYRKAGDLERARKVLSEGIERHPDYSSAHVVLGRVLMDQGEHDEARAEFDRVLELDGQNLVAHRSLGDIARAEGRTDDALEHYRTLMDLEPSDTDVRELVDELTGAADEVDAAEAADEEGVAAAADEEDTAAAADEEGAVGEWNEEPEEPEEPEEQAVAAGDSPSDEEPATGGEDGDDADVMTETIAQVYARQGLYDRAAEVYQQLVRARPDDDELRERLAEMEAKAGGSEDGEAEPRGTDREEMAVEPVAGFETGQIDSDEVDVEPLEGLESDELDPETGLAELEEADEGLEPEPGLTTFEAREEPEGDPWDVDDEDWDVEDEGDWDVVSDDDWDAEYEEAEWDVPVGEEDRDVEDEEATESGEYWSPEAEGWDTDEPEAAVSDVTDEAAADEAEPVAADVPDAGAAPGDEEPASPWTEDDWSGETESDASPYAWGGAEEAEADESPPIRDYLHGLLAWGAGEAGPAAEPESVDGATDVSDASTPTEPGGSDDDDDLEMFRSWLESLKQ